MSYPVLYPQYARPSGTAVVNDAIANEAIVWGSGSAVAGIAVAGDAIVGVGSAINVTDPFDNMGIGVLSDAISCTVTEQRNGSYELTMTYPYTGMYFNEIRYRRIIMAKPNYTDDPQPFRIYKITKPINGICTIYAQHLSYDLSGFEMPHGKVAWRASRACLTLNAWATPFNITSEFDTDSLKFETTEPASVRSWMSGKEGSITDIYGGEWHYDRYACTLMLNRGTDRGVSIRYGKNLTSLKQDEECSNVYSGVKAWWKGSDKIVEGDRVSTGIILDMTRTLLVDASGSFTEEPSAADLTSWTEDYIEKNTLNTPKVNLTLDYVQLNGLTDRVDLCDTVRIYFEELGVSAVTKCIETTWDVLRDRYSSTKFGEPLPNIADTIAGLARRI